MRLSTSNIATAGAFTDDLKTMSKKSSALQRLLFHLKSDITHASKDLTDFHRSTKIHKHDAYAMAVWVRAWQAMQSIVAMYRSRIVQLLTHSNHHSHFHQATGLSQSAHSKRLFAARAPQRLTPLSRLNRRRLGKINLEEEHYPIESLDDAHWLVQELADNLSDDMQDGDIETILFRWIPWEKYSQPQQQLLMQAIQKYLGKTKPAATKIET